MQLCFGWFCTFVLLHIYQRGTSFIQTGISIRCRICEWRKIRILYNIQNQKRNHTFRGEKIDLSKTNSFKVAIISSICPLHTQNMLNTYTFNIHGSLHRNNILLYKFQQDVHVTKFILSDNCSTCFGGYYHPSSGAQTTVITASGNRYTVLLSAAIVEELEPV